MKNFERFVQLELSGYDSVTEQDIPEHRFFSARFKNDASIVDTPIESKLLKRFTIKESIAIIENNFQQMVKSNVLFYYRPCAEKVNEALRAEFKIHADFQCIFPRQEYLRVIQSVKGIVQDWTSELKKMNIYGENLMFSGEDKTKAQSIHFHNSIIGVVGNPQSSTTIQNINNGVVQGDFESLKEFLVKSGLPTDDIECLKKIDNEEKNNPAGFRSKVFTWLGNLGSKIEDAIIVVVTQAVLKYYDLLGK